MLASTRTSTGCGTTWTMSSRGTSTRPWPRPGWIGICIPEKYGGGGRGRPGGGVAPRGGHRQRRGARRGHYRPGRPVRPGADRQVRHARSSASASCARRPGQPPGVLRRHRTRCRHRHHQHHHVRPEGPRRLPGQRPEDLHLTGRTGRAAAADHPAPHRVGRREADRRHDPVLAGHGPRTTSGSSPSPSSAATRSRPTCCSSTTCSSRTRTASARRARGFRYLLAGLNAERIIVAGGCLGMGREALRRAVSTPSSAWSSAARSG